MPTRADRPDDSRMCLVCGLDCVSVGEDHPWGESGLDPSYNFCPCCGVEFGYADFSIEGARRYRSTWQERGCPWERQELRPDGWVPETQFAHLPERTR
jgi:hypothetical protein